MEILIDPGKKNRKDILKRPVIDSCSLEATVMEILKTVRSKGDKAVAEYCLRFDGYSSDSFSVTDAEIRNAEKMISPELKKAIQTAYRNIYKFHSRQIERISKVETMPGVLCWRRAIGIEKVGLYIPGGSAPLFSTVLMLAIPAKIAGCAEVSLFTPANKQGKVNPAILFAAKASGIKKIYKIGGVQAVAAMAYGTETISSVYKIFGPGNQYVTCAKQLVNRDGIAIDMPAGPSEVAVLADDSAIPEFVAADLLSQAEHGADSQVLLVSPSKRMIERTQTELMKQSAELPRREVAEKALRNSKAILVSDIKNGIDLINEYAPEHLILSCKKNDSLAGKIVNAGSVFLGNYTPESAGDYASGTNHTLPTNGYARMYSGVSLDSFVRKITFQKISEKGLKKLGKTIETMAEAESLIAHKNAVSIRLKYKKK